MCWWRALRPVATYSPEARKAGAERPATASTAETMQPTKPSERVAFSPIATGETSS